MQLSIQLPAPAPVVYSALTDETRLKQWLTEHARVSIGDGVYELWGRYLPEAPLSAATRLLEARDARLLRFAWKLRGAESTVTLELAPRGESTHLAVTHIAPDRPDGHPSTDDFWGHSLENLRRLMAAGSGPIFCDYSTRPVGGAIVTADIEAPADRVFDALLNPRELERYIAKKATVEPRVGGSYSVGWQGGEGPMKILELEPAKKLAYSWHYHEHDRDTVVTWTLEGSGSRTRLTLVHSGFAPDRYSEDYRSGWMKYVNELKSMLEIGPAWTAAAFEDPECAA